MEILLPLPKLEAKKYTLDYIPKVKLDVVQKIENLAWPVPALAAFGKLSVDEIFEVKGPEDWPDCCKNIGKLVGFTAMKVQAFTTLDDQNEHRKIYVGFETGNAIAVFHECLHWLSHTSFQKASNALANKRLRQAMVEGTTEQLTLSLINKEKRPKLAVYEQELGDFRVCFSPDQPDQMAKVRKAYFEGSPEDIDYMTKMLVGMQSLLSK